MPSLGSGFPPEMIEQDVPRAVGWCFRIRYDEDIRGRVFAAGEQGRKISFRHLARCEGLRKKAHADAEQGQTLGLFQVFRQAGYTAPDVVAHAKPRQLVRLVGSRQDDGFAGEGLGAFDEEQNHDTKIFLLALLMSSLLVYNSMGAIDENALNNLSLVVNLSQSLQIKRGQKDLDPDELA